MDRLGEQRRTGFAPSHGLRVHVLALLPRPVRYGRHRRRAEHTARHAIVGPGCPQAAYEDVIAGEVESFQADSVRVAPPTAPLTNQLPAKEVRKRGVSALDQEQVLLQYHFVSVAEYYALWHLAD